MKKALFLAVSVVVASFLHADIMNWQVNDSSLSDCNWAALKWADSATTTASDDNILAESALSNGQGQEKQLDLASLVGAGYNTKYFFIEVGNYTDQGFQVAKNAGAYSYSDLVSAGLISTGSMNPPSGLTFGQSGVTIAGTPMSYGAATEPSSAMLILLGLAVAGLKRRRA